MFLSTLTNWEGARKEAMCPSEQKKELENSRTGIYALICPEWYKLSQLNEVPKSPHL